jgi:hypothetical protein
MTTGAYMLIALIIGSGSCQEPQFIVRKMGSPELCKAAANLVTKGGGLSDCLPVSSASAGVARAHRQHWQEKRSTSDAGAEEVQQLNRAQLGEQ